MLYELKSDAGTAIGLVQDKEEYLQSFWVAGKFYEQEMLEYIWEKYRGGRTFIDVGSCIGNHTLFFAKFCCNRVISIEPQAELFQHQMNVLRMNHVSGKVYLHHAAIGHNQLWGHVANDEFERNVGMGKVVPSTVYNQADVAVYTLFHYANMCDNIDLIKIDVEGMELDVLLGAESTLLKHKPVIFIEITENEAEVRKLLDNYGYVEVRQFEPFQTWEFVYIGAYCDR